MPQEGKQQNESSEPQGELDLMGPDGNDVVFSNDREVVSFLEDKMQKF